MCNIPHKKLLFDGTSVINMCNMCNIPHKNITLTFFCHFGVIKIFTKYNFIIFWVLELCHVYNA